MTLKGEIRNSYIILAGISSRKFLEKEVRIEDDTKMRVLIVFTWLKIVEYGGFFQAL